MYTSFGGTGCDCQYSTTTFEEERRQHLEASLKSIRGAFPWPHNSRGTLTFMLRT